MGSADSFSEPVLMKSHNNHRVMPVVIFMDFFMFAC